MAECGQLELFKQARTQVSRETFLENHEQTAISHSWTFLLSLSIRHVLRVR